MMTLPVGKNERDEYKKWPQICNQQQQRVECERVEKERKKKMDFKTTLLRPSLKSNKTPGKETLEFSPELAFGTRKHSSRVHSSSQCSGGS